MVSLHERDLSADSSRFAAALLDSAHHGHQQLSVRDHRDGAETLQAVQAVQADGEMPLTGGTTL